MIRLMFLFAFLAGAAAVTGMSLIFLGTDMLALGITLIIAFVYAIGAIELIQFHLATQSLHLGLKQIPDFSTQQVESNQQLTQWLDNLHRSLKYAVHSRIEGESKGLPSPVLTPYLVGLLVMLGLLGTFVGMVDTLQGSVIALQGSTDLAAIREGLAAPITGLGAAFGTSVAGVAASAMLGLMSTLCRRERILVTRELDAKINTDFRPFSLNFNRQETYKSLQQQARALPEVASQISLMAQTLESMGQRLGEQLNAKQDNFHDAVEKRYQALADSVSSSLNQVVQKSGHLVAEQVSPAVAGVMAEMSDTMKKHLLNTQASLLEQTEHCLGAVSQQLHEHVLASQTTWQDGLRSHQEIQVNVSESMSQSLADFKQQFEDMSAELVKQFLAQTQANEANREASDARKFSQWAEAFNEFQQASQAKIDASAQTQMQLWQTASSSFVEQSTQVADALSLAAQSQSDAHTASLEQLSNTIEGLQLAAQRATEQATKQAEVLDAATERSIETREKAEANWVSQHSQMMDSVSKQLEQQLSALRDQESERADKALGQLGKLEQTVANQLAELGQALEAPMHRLIETASEAPKAAAEVISKLKQEMSVNLERDNTLLEERRRIMSELDGLSDSLAQSTVNQGKAMEALLESSGGMLADISERFDQKVEREVSKLSDIAMHFSESSIDLSSMSSAFLGAVERFSESNNVLVEKLGTIEVALETAGERNNEQLAYYVAQAREIIDHSMMSQRGLIEEINQMAVQRLEAEEA